MTFLIKKNLKKGPKKAKKGQNLSKIDHFFEPYGVLGVYLHVFWDFGFDFLHIPYITIKYIKISII